MDAAVDTNLFKLINIIDCSLLRAVHNDTRKANEKAKSAYLVTFSAAKCEHLKFVHTATTTAFFCVVAVMNGFNTHS